MKLILFIFTLMLIPESYAQQSKSESFNEEYKKGFIDGQKAAKSELQVKTSEENRTGKKYELGLAYGPDYKEITQQLFMGHYISKNELLLLKLGYMKKSNGYWQHTQSNLSLQYKRFITNSFYLAPELTYLDKYSKNVDENSSARDNYILGTGIGIRIGNQWSWQNFTIGCDWIGLGQLIATFKQFDESKTYATLLNSYIGYSF